MSELKDIQNGRDTGFGEKLTPEVPGRNLLRQHLPNRPRDWNRAPNFYQSGETVAETCINWVQPMTAACFLLFSCTRETVFQHTQCLRSSWI